MLTFLKWLFYLIAAVALIIVGGSFLLPPQAVVTRSIEIAAPPTLGNNPRMALAR